MELLGVAGSLRRGSYNRKLLRAAGALLPSGVRFTEYDRLKAIPAFDEDDEASLPPAVSHWRAAIEQADGILFATPEYNSSVPGQLKNAVDWASRPVATAVLRNKPVAVIGAGTGMFGAVWSQAELRKALASAGARVLDRELPLPAVHEAFDENGSLKDHGITLEVEGVITELVGSVRQRLAA